jgi:uncharacterized membrane protein YqgA involved in biofilm formation
MFVGAGTLLNVVAVLIGGSLGVLLGQRLPKRVQDVVTDGLGLLTLAIGVLNILAVSEPTLSRTVGDGWPLIVVLGAVLIGGIIGASLHLERQLANLGDWLRRLGSRPRTPISGGDDDSDEPARLRFIDGFVTASLVFCVGPLTILGSLADGLGDGVELLALKSALDGFAALAFAASLGWGVVASAFTVLIVQGSLTLLGVWLGDVINAAGVAAITATGGILLLGVGLRLLRIKQVPVADLLPALAIAPLLVLLLDRFQDIS